MNRDDHTALTCSFCGKTQDKVRRLIAGPTAYICDECIKIGLDMISVEITNEGSPVGRVEHAPGVHASELAVRAQRFADSCDRAVDLLRPVAEGARALAEELELLVSSKADSQAVLTEYALGVMAMARSFATACDALELPQAVAQRARTLADETPHRSSARKQNSRPNLRTHHMLGDRMDGDDGSDLTCSFCGKKEHEVRELMAGAKAHICDECIGLCLDIIAEEIAKEEDDREFPATSPKGRPSALSLNASKLVLTAQLFADSCDAFVELPRPIAERARALAGELELFTSSNADSRTVLTEHALSLMVMARYFASACDALELPGDIAQRTRILADAIGALFPPPVSR